MEKGCIFCKVESEYLWITCSNYSLQWACRSSGSWSPTSHCKGSVSIPDQSMSDCREHSGPEQISPPSASVSPVSVITPTLHTHLHLHADLTIRAKPRSLGTFTPSNALSYIRGAFDRQVIPYRFFLVSKWLKSVTYSLKNHQN
jgi:hypothetical protein